MNETGNYYEKEKVYDVKSYCANNGIISLILC